MEANKACKKEEILDVAEKLFSEQGFEAVSVRKIAQVAHINIAMISYYFGSKEKLYEAVIRRKIVSTDIIQSQIENSNSQTEALFTVIDFFVDRFFENKQFLKLIFREMALRQRKRMPDFITENTYKNFSFIYKIIDKGIQDGEFKSVDIDLTIMSIMGIIKTYTTSTSIVSKVMNENSTDIFEDKNKTRLKKFMKQLMIDHLDIKTIV